MTNILLSIIAVLLFARILLQVWQGKRAVEKGYAAPREVEHITDICNYDAFKIDDIIRKRSTENWELVTIMPIDISGVKCYEPFFTRKKIKIYYDETT